MTEMDLNGVRLIAVGTTFDGRAAPGLNEQRAGSETMDRTSSTSTPSGLSAGDPAARTEDLVLKAMAQMVRRRSVKPTGCSQTSFSPICFVRCSVPTAPSSPGRPASDAGAASDATCCRRTTHTTSWARLMSNTECYKRVRPRHAGLVIPRSGSKTWVLHLCP